MCTFQVRPHCSKSTNFDPKLYLISLPSPDSTKIYFTKHTIIGIVKTNRFWVLRYSFLWLTNQEVKRRLYRNRSPQNSQTLKITCDFIFIFLSTKFFFFFWSLAIFTDRQFDLKGVLNVRKSEFHAKATFTIIKKTIINIWIFEIIQ